MIAFALGKCRIELGFSCFALFSFCCLFPAAGSGAFFLAAALLHELGHGAAMAAFGAAPSAITLSALGCRMVPGKTLSYPQGAAVSLAGPGMNLLCAAGAFALGAGDSPFFAASLALGLLHSLPIAPLDGGLALHSLLRQALPPETAGRASLAVGLSLLFPLACLGFLVLLRTRYNFTLLALSVYLMLYLVLGKDLSL